MQELGRLSLGGGGEPIYTISIHFFYFSFAPQKKCANTQPPFLSSRSGTQEGW
jgi:hypothetical protein